LIELKRPRGIGDDQTDMMNGTDQRHRIPLGMEPAWTFAYTNPRPERDARFRVSSTFDASMVLSGVRGLKFYIF
jgi:hypothetical protein